MWVGTFRCSQVFLRTFSWLKIIAINIYCISHFIMAKLAAKPTSKQITNNTLHDHVEDLWAINEADEYHGVKKAVMEAQSKPPTHQLLFPEFMKDSRFRHGITTSKAYDEDAKKLIYANEICEQTENTKQPWSQRRRNYNWPSNTNPETTIFGIKSKANAGTVKGSNGAGVAEALCMNGDSHVDPEVKAINTFAFGKPTSSSNSSTAECLGYQTCTSDILGETDPTEKDDIGKSLKPGYRNVMTTRCFGCPSIRTDIPNNSRSIADTQNYGEDLDAMSGGMLDEMAEAEMERAEVLDEDLDDALAVPFAASCLERACGGGGEAEECFDEMITEDKAETEEEKRRRQ